MFDGVLLHPQYFARLVNQLELAIGNHQFLASAWLPPGRGKPSANPQIPLFCAGHAAPPLLRSVRCLVLTSLLPRRATPRPRWDRGMIARPLIIIEPNIALRFNASSNGSKDFWPPKRLSLGWWS